MKRSDKQKAKEIAPRPQREAAPEPLKGSAPMPKGEAEPEPLKRIAPRLKREAEPEPLAGLRTVRSGSVGLDLALGGGFRFVRRTHLGNQESATLLIRGGPGVGKGVLAQDLALRLATALEGDVLHVCLGVSPSEVMAQRLGAGGFDPARVVNLSRPAKAPAATTEPGATSAAAPGPHLLLAMHEVSAKSDGRPDLGEALRRLAKVALQRGFVPKVVVVDSLSDGYVLGNSVPRATADEICQLAIEQGWALLLLEEAVDASISPWAFVVDTVLSIQLASVPGSGLLRRELLVTKHRFASCEPGPHRLEFEPGRVRVIPPLSAYRNAARDLQLPLPAKERSLRIKLVGSAPSWKAFALPDGKGCCLAVSGEVNAEALASVAQLIGRLAVDGKHTPGGLATLALQDPRSWPPWSDKTGFSVGSLPPFVDGEGWLEDALTRLAALPLALSRLRIGPTNALDLQENQADLRRALALLVDLLESRGLLVVLYGSRDSLSRTIPAALISRSWTLARLGPAGTTHGQLTISTDPDPRLTLVPKLD